MKIFVICGLKRFFFGNPDPRFLVEGRPIGLEPASVRQSGPTRLSFREGFYALALRLITSRTRRGHQVAFLTNEFELEPRLIAFLSSRRWEEEKCFATWKNDFSLAKAWGTSMVAITNQACPAIITSLLVALLLHRMMGTQGVEDEKALQKQDRRQTSETDGTDRPDRATPIFRYTSKVSRQVLRFFKHGFHKPASQVLYDARLRPLLLACYIRSRTPLSQWQNRIDVIGISALLY